MEREDLQLIEQYFEGALDEKGLLDFHVKMETNPEFAEAVRLEKDILDGVELLGNEELKRQLEKIGKEEIGGAEIKNINKGRRRLLWAAAAVLALALIAKFAADSSQPDTEKLYAEYAIHDFDFTEKSNGADNLSEIESLLKSEKYAEAIPLIEKYLSENTGASDVKLSYGIALLETNRLDQAHTVFKEIRSEVPLLKYDATWYRALTFLRQGDLKGCRVALATIPEKSARFDSAQELLEEL